MYLDGTPMPGEQHPPMVALRTGARRLDRVMGIQQPDGTRVWLSVNAQPLFEPDGRTLSGVVSSFFDITERIRSEEERARLLREAQEAVRVRDEFLSVASHELRTPLTPLSLKLHTLLRAAQSAPEGTVPAARVAADVQVAQRQVRKLADLIRDLLDVSRLAHGKLSLNLEDVDLAALTREVTAELAPEAERAGFGRFERAVSERHYGGLGLGLSITHQAVQALGGAIHVESEPGQGATFTVRFPLRGARA